MIVTHTVRRNLNDHVSDETKSYVAEEVRQYLSNEGIDTFKEYAVEYKVDIQITFENGRKLKRRHT